MTCIAVLIRPNDNKILKTERITKNTYILCEDVIKKRNEKQYKDSRFWQITAINV